MFEFVISNNSCIVPTLASSSAHQCQRAKISIKKHINNFFGHYFALYYNLNFNLLSQMSIYNHFLGFWLQFFNGELLLEIKVSVIGSVSKSHIRPRKAPNKPLFCPSTLCSPLPHLQCVARKRPTAPTRCVNRLTINPQTRLVLFNIAPLHAPSNAQFRVEI